MVYVEFQRVLRALKWTAIVLAILTVLIVIVDAWLLFVVMSAPLSDVKFDNGKTGADIVRTTPAVHLVLLRSLNRPPASHRLWL